MAHLGTVDTTQIPLTNTAEVLDHIEKEMVETKFRGHTQIFLPQPELDFLTSEETIRQIVAKDNDAWLSQQDQKAFIQEVFQKGRKMFITCVYGELPMTCLKALLKDGLTDEKFPFKLGDCQGQSNKRKFRRGFIENQKFFNTAFFSLNSEQNLDGEITKPIDYDESALLGKGAFGEVVRVKIPRSQRDFSSGANKKDQFAMKITQHKGTREESFHRAMADLYHCHLVKCLSSFIHSSKYYMIYEKADCNVEEFMKTNPEPHNLSSLSPEDFAQQLFGLADGLFFVHNQGRSESSHNNKLLNVPVNIPQKTAYFHDIKPENLLVFIYNMDGKKTYWVRLSDFSCAKVVDLVASVSGQHRDSWRSTSKSGTPVYRAPEITMVGKSSRPYDLWSLGCVYLELLVWFLDGYESLTHFRESRRLFSANGREDDGFYFSQDDGKNAQHQLREAVNEKMDDISRRCKGSLKDIADTIPQLLQINPSRRPTAEDLVKSLRHIDTGARPPVEIGPSQQHIAPTSTLPSFEAYSSDSDSDFGGLIKVQQPTNE